MKAYGGREAPKTNAQEMAVHTSRETLFDALKQAELLERLGPKLGVKFAKLDPLRWGVNWGAYKPETGKGVALFQVDRLGYAFSAHDVHPYPLAPFLSYPVSQVARTKVGLIIQFSDCIATSRLDRFQTEFAAALDLQFGSTIADAGADAGVIKQPIIAIPSSAFRLVEEAKK
jgi:hypothetical protein